MAAIDWDKVVLAEKDGTNNAPPNVGTSTKVQQRIMARLFKSKRKNCCNDLDTQKVYYQAETRKRSFRPMRMLSAAIIRLISPRPRYPPGVRKPIIYIFSPTAIDVDVSVSLSTELAFAAIYPVVPVEKCAGMETIRWNVRTQLDGSLTENDTGLEVSYLFWEADVNKAAVLSPPPSPIVGQSNATEYFSPASCTLSDSDSVVLPTSKVPIYLDRSLRALGLHTEARTSFITFWLPSLEKKEYVALRFIPQAAYARAAPMKIVPEADIVTRVFMVFCGVEEKSALKDWPNAIARAEDDVEWWQDIVGVDKERALDQRLFRVLEWGGMEVVN